MCAYTFLSEHFWAGIFGLQCTGWKSIGRVGAAAWPSITTVNTDLSCVVIHHSPGIYWWRNVHIWEYYSLFRTFDIGKFLYPNVCCFTLCSPRWMQLKGLSMAWGLCLLVERGEATMSAMEGSRAIWGSFPRRWGRIFTTLRLSQAL